MPWSSQTGRVMKKPEEYSKNPNTVRARARKARLDPYTREVEQAKASDSKAVTRAWKQRIEKADYENAPADVRKAMLEETEREVMQRRKSRGYDADSKIDRFCRQAGVIVPDTPSTATSAAALSTHPYGHMSPLPGFMQPVAQMQPAPFTGQVDVPGAAPGSYYGHVMPTIEDQRAMAEVPHFHQFLRQGTPRSTDSALGYHSLALSGQQDDIFEAPDAAILPSLLGEVKKLKMRSAELEKAVIGLRDDLVLARSTIRSQEARMTHLEEHMQIYLDTATSLNSSEADCARRASIHRQFPFGVQRISNVTTEVLPNLVDASFSNVSANGVINEFSQGFQDTIAKNIARGPRPLLGMFATTRGVANNIVEQEGSNAGCKHGDEGDDADMTDIESDSESNGVKSDVK